jgi:hypothetical protein
MRELGDLTSPVDLTDRLTLTRWLSRVRDHVTALNALLQAVPPTPYVHVEVFGAPGKVPTVTLEREDAPEETRIVRLVRQTKQDVVVYLPNGEVRVFRRSSGAERRDPGDFRPPSGFRLVLPRPAPEPPPTPSPLPPRPKRTRGNKAA